MLEPPQDLGDDEVLATVQRHWPGAGVDAVEHLAVGFGAHHWRASSGWRPVLFVTYDDTGGERHTPASLEAAYATAAELAFRLDVVVAGLAGESGRWTVPVASGALSVTPWVHGERAGDGPPTDRVDAERIAGVLARLHAAPPPSRLPRWQPLVVTEPDLGGTWTGGPLGETARSLLLAHADDVRGWTARHAALADAALAAADRWVVTHGEPHTRNQLRTPVRTLLVDWESVRLAPRERDLLGLAQAGYAGLVDPDPAMLELFDLEWRLDEVRQGVTRFDGPHTGGADDQEALAGLREELVRPAVSSWSG